MAQKKGIIARIIGAISRIFRRSGKKPAAREKVTVARIPSVNASPKERQAAISEAKKAAKRRTGKTRKAVKAKPIPKAAKIKSGIGGAGAVKTAAVEGAAAEISAKGAVKTAAVAKVPAKAAAGRVRKKASESTESIQRRIVEQQARTTESLAEIAGAIKELTKKRAEAEPYPERYAFIQKANALEGEMDVVKRLMKALEVEFLRRRIDKDQFQAKMFEYQQMLRELSERKKLASSGKATMEPLPKGPVTMVEKILGDDKLAGVDPGRINSIDRRLKLIMEKYNVPESEVAERAKGVDQGAVIESFGKLINMIEREESKKRGLGIKAAPVETVAPKEIIMKMAKVKPVMKDISSHNVVTDFDKVLAAVNEKGRASTGELAKALRSDRKRVEEIVKVLEENGLVDIKYSTIGGARVFSKLPGRGAGKGGAKNGGKGA